MHQRNIESTKSYKLNLLSDLLWIYNLRKTPGEPNASNRSEYGMKILLTKSASIYTAINITARLARSLNSDMKTALADNGHL